MKSFKEIEEYASEHFIPIARKDFVEFFMDLIIKNDYREVLEIGSAIGCTTLHLASLNNVYVTTIEHDENRFKICEQNIKDFNLEDKIECIVFDYSELNSYEFESYKEYNLPEENLIYRFNKTEAIDFEKRKDIEIPITSSILDCFKFDNIDYVYTKPNELIFKYSDDVHLLKKFKTNSVDFIISTVIEEKDNYEGYGLRYKRYIPKKTTKGITDLRNNPFAWLNY